MSQLRTEDLGQPDEKGMEAERALKDLRETRGQCRSGSGEVQCGWAEKVGRV
jgi:hypothetical protein